MWKLVYLIKVYLVTIIFSPTLYFLLDGNLNLSFNSKALIGFLELILIAVIMGGILSSPTFITLGYFLNVYSIKLSRLLLLIFLCLISLLGTFATFAIFDSHSFFHLSKALYFPLTYALVLVFSIIVFYPKSTKLS